MNMKEVGRPSSIHKPPPSMTAVELRLLLHAGEKITIVDVREPAAFVPRHLPGSINSPDSQTTALVKRMQTIDRAVIVCENGRASALVVRTLAFCGFRELAYLEGGMEAWTAAGCGLAETTRSGFERLIPKDDPFAEPPKPRLLDRLLSAIKQTV